MLSWFRSGPKTLGELEDIVDDAKHNDADSAIAHLVLEKLPSSIDEMYDSLNTAIPGIEDAFEYLESQHAITESEGVYSLANDIILPRVHPRSVSFTSENTDFLRLMAKKSPMHSKYVGEKLMFYRRAKNFNDLELLELFPDGSDFTGTLRTQYNLLEAHDLVYAKNVAGFFSVARERSE